MPQSHIHDPPKPGDLSPPCDMCGMPMFLSHVEPAEKADHDRRAFECLACQHSKIEIIKYK
jgi:hypothetical protein